ncbi:vesicle-mediated transport protein [Aureococcus anophagefferens]|uniref:Vesicle transport protein n=2 Tax=Aureococcus anophagefferens TaxID=44056 RepID=A0ABR1FIF2_AURAN
MGGESGWDVMKGFDGLPKLPEWESIQQKLDEAKAKSLEGMAAARKTSIELGAVAAVNASSLKTRLAADASKTFQRVASTVDGGGGGEGGGGGDVEAGLDDAGGFAARVADGARSVGDGVKDNFKSAAHDPKECGLDRAQRFKWYVALLMVAAAFFSTALNFLPLVVIKPAKFATAFCIGTVASIAAKFMLNGPLTQLRKMVALRKLPYTLALFASTALTLYACFGLGNFVAIVLSSGMQIAALLYYLFGDTPGGIAGIKLLGRLVLKTAKLIVSPCLSAFRGDP